MSFAQFSKSFDGSMYDHARKWESPAGLRCQPLQFMGMEAKKEGFWPEDTELERLTARLIKKYHVPDDDYSANRRTQLKELAAHKWIIDSYLKQYRVTTEGPHADTVQKAFSVVPAELTVFPFFWDTIIIEQILAVPLLDILVADTVSINSGTYVHALMNETVTDRSTGETGEFGTFIEVNISSTESTVKLKKFGAQVSVSDEAMRRQRIPVFARGFARYGRQFGIDMTDLAIDITLNGDGAYGGGGAAATTVAAAVSGSPTYSDYVSLMLNFDIGYEPTDVIWSRAGITKLLSIPEFKDPLAGFKFQSTAILPEIFGLMGHRWDSTRSSSWTSGGLSGDGTKALAIQRGRSLVMAQEGGLATESVRDPRQQETIITTSWYLMFTIADGNARRVLTGVA